MHILNKSTAHVLEHATLRLSTDSVKTDLELRCDRCGLHLCDAQHGDTLHTLANVAILHDSWHREIGKSLDTGTLYVTVVDGWPRSFGVSPDGVGMYWYDTADEAANEAIDTPEFPIVLTTAAALDAIRS